MFLAIAVDNLSEPDSSDEEEEPPQKELEKDLDNKDNGTKEVVLQGEDAKVTIDEEYPEEFDEYDLPYMEGKIFSWFIFINFFFSTPFKRER